MDVALLRHEAFYWCDHSTVFLRRLCTAGADTRPNEREGKTLSDFCKLFTMALYENRTMGRRGVALSQ
jgi:hypothetical protein